MTFESFAFWATLALMVLVVASGLRALFVSTEQEETFPIVPLEWKEHFKKTREARCKFWVKMTITFCLLMFASCVTFAVSTLR